MARRLDVLYAVGVGLWAASMAGGLIAGPPALWSSSSFDALRRWPGLAAWGAPYVLLVILSVLALLGHWRRWPATAPLFKGMAVLAFGLTVGLVLTFVAAWFYGDLVGLTGVVNGTFVAYAHLLFALHGGRHEQSGRVADQLDGVPRAARDGAEHHRGAGQGLDRWPPPPQRAPGAAGRRGPLAPA